MKKLLLALLIVALGYLTYTTIANGTTVFGLTIPSYKTLTEKNDKLDTDIADLSKSINIDYSVAVTSVASSKTKFNKAKQEYDSVAANATDEQLEAAMKEEEFLLDYLWIVVGNYAEDNNVKFWMNTAENATLEFDVTGTYISIINFVYDLSNDPELRFVIDNIQLEAGASKNTVTKAKFTVEGITVVTK